jgi:hypothetical protein
MGGGLAVVKNHSVIRWLFLGYVIVSLGIALAYGSWVHKTDSRQDVRDAQIARLAAEVCAFTIFTRETQQQVILYLGRMRVAVAHSALSPAIRAFFDSEQGTLARLLGRSVPPPSCVEDPV